MYGINKKYFLHLMLETAAKKRLNENVPQFYTEEIQEVKQSKIGESDVLMYLKLLLK